MWTCSAIPKTVTTQFVETDKCKLPPNSMCITRVDHYPYDETGTIVDSFQDCQTACAWDNEHPDIIRALDAKGWRLIGYCLPPEAGKWPCVSIDANMPVR